VFSRFRWYQPATECCYNPYYGFLIDIPIPGAGRSHLYHPQPHWFFFYYYNYYSNYNEEENAYRSCCLTGNNFFCQLFYSLRPPCTALRWWQSRSRWGEFFNIMGILSSTL
jgi:hypothetical protein